MSISSNSSTKSGRRINKEKKNHQETYPPSPNKRSEFLRDEWLLRSRFSTCHLEKEYNENKKKDKREQEETRLRWREFSIIPNKNDFHLRLSPKNIILHLENLSASNFSWTFWINMNSVNNTAHKVYFHLDPKLFISLMNVNIYRSSKIIPLPKTCLRNARNVYNKLIFWKKHLPEKCDHNTPPQVSWWIDFTEICRMSNSHTYHPSIKRATNRKKPTKIR